MSVRSLRYNTIEQHFTKSALASTDRDALAFLEAAQIYNTNDQRAIVNLVRSLKRTGLWSKMKAIYPFIGGTATTHKWNLKDPRDVDAAYRIGFNGGWTHNLNGITGNGSNSWADCNILPSALASGSSHLAIYSRTNNTGAYFDFTSYEVGTQFSHTIYMRNASNVFVVQAYKFPENEIAGTNTDSSGLFIVSRTSTTSAKGFRNGVQIGATDTDTALGFANLSKRYSIGTNQDALYTTVSNRNYAFATIGDGLTDADVTNLYNIVDLYQKRLGRAV